MDMKGVAPLWMRPYSQLDDLHCLLFPFLEQTQEDTVLSMQTTVHWRNYLIRNGSPNCQNEETQYCKENELLMIISDLDKNFVIECGLLATCHQSPFPLICT